MGNPIFSPDGKFMWTGTEWIPSPPEPGANQPSNLNEDLPNSDQGMLPAEKDASLVDPIHASDVAETVNRNLEQPLHNTLSMQDSVIGGDVVTNTTINNDPSAVTAAVISALQHLGMINIPVHENAPPASIELPNKFIVGDHVEYFSPTNQKWLNRCKIIDINTDGTYKIEVPKSNLIEIKNGVTIGVRPGCIRPAITPYKTGDRVFVNWKNYGHYYAGRIAKENSDDTFLVHFDDGDVEDNVDWSRIMPLDETSDEVKSYIAKDNEAEEELIEAFKIFDPLNTGTISAQEYLRILTEIGENPLSADEVKQEFSELGIDLDSQIDYKQLAKYLVASEDSYSEIESKPEVVIKDAKVIDGILNGYSYNHPRLGETWVNTSKIQSISYDERATARVTTLNSIYVVGPTGWIERPSDHPFNTPNYKPGQNVKVEWNGTWWDALVREINTDVISEKKYLIHYVGFDSSWDEWVDASRIKS